MECGRNNDSRRENRVRRCKLYQPLPLALYGKHSMAGKLLLPMHTQPRQHMQRTDVES